MLPLILYEYFMLPDPPKGVLLLLKLLDITDILMAMVIDKEWLANLHLLIMELFGQVNELNPLAVRPKFHYLVHYPHLIQQYGPPRQYYTMRFEALHQYFKTDYRES